MCGICLEPFAPSSPNGVKAFRCQYHAFCASCLATFFELHILEGALENLECPILTCRKRQVQVPSLQALVNVNSFERFLTVALNRALDAMSDLTWCPKCHTAVLSDAEGHGYGHCSQCDFCFCVTCSEAWHTGRCGAVWVEADPEDTPAMEQPGKPVNKDMEDRMVMALTTKRCPNCLVHIEKNGGCNHMVCSRCRIHFQWDQAPRSLFATSKVMATIARKHAEEHRERVEREKVAEQAAKKERLAALKRVTRDPNTRACPNCRMLQEKQGNSNSLTCRNCRTGFCFECGLRIQGTKHFSAPSSTCRQHSPLKTATSTTPTASSSA